MFILTAKARQHWAHYYTVLLFCCSTVRGNAPTRRHKANTKASMSTPSRAVMVESLSELDTAVLTRSSTIWTAK